jgi:hypothetical protein
VTAVGVKVGVHYFSTRNPCCGKSARILPASSRR